jgi:predicted Zn-dependent protease
MMRIDFPTRRFTVENVLITAWYRDGTQVSAGDIHRTLRHEMGHALGIAGHSPNPEDIMYALAPSTSQKLTDRDRETLRKLYAKPNGTVLAGVRRVY